MVRLALAAGLAGAWGASKATLEPESFGAVGDGVADDTEALRRTLDGCMNVTADVCTVHLKAPHVLFEGYMHSALHITAPNKL